MPFCLFVHSFVFYSFICRHVLYLAWTI